MLEENQERIETESRERERSITAVERETEVGFDKTNFKIIIHSSLFSLFIFDHD